MKTSYTHRERAQKGGFARAAKLTPRQRSMSARRAAKAMWAQRAMLAAYGNEINAKRRKV